jgi:hypothetical protein
LGYTAVGHLSQRKRDKNKVDYEMYYEDHRQMYLVVDRVCSQVSALALLNIVDQPLLC